MVPNCFPDMGENPEYNSIDASLWFIFAVDRYFAHSQQDDTRVRYARYRPRYQGGSMVRDSAYHQGTVWPFLLGFFVTAWLNTYGRSAKARIKGRSFLEGLESHLQEACLGQVSEVFDGDAPHHPGGCPAQAWSVAEPLRALVEDLEVLMTPSEFAHPHANSFRQND